MSPTPRTIAFDVYGTLVDPLGMAAHLTPVVGGERATEAAALWRWTQIEYALRRGLMGPDRYVDFDVCTAQALVWTLRAFGVDPDADPAVAAALLAAYRALPAFPDALPGLDRLRAAGHTLLAFSNGTEASLHALLGQAGLRPLLDGIVSVDPLRTFKPDPAVYRHLVEQGSGAPATTWLVTANAWDAIGAKAAGLRVAWLRRDPAAHFDPWEVDLGPDVVITRLEEIGPLLERILHP